MQSTLTGHIASSEWRWLIVVSAMLLAVAFLPFLILAIAQQSSTDWQFMGAFHQHIDSAVYLSKMQQGIQNNWLIYMLHTPEPHGGTLLNGLYVFLGHLSRLLYMPPVLVFHLVRLVVSLFMYIALYQLGASIWIKLRTRRIFFLFVVLVSGLGWIFVVFMQRINPPDFNTMQWYPFTSTLTNIHFPLAIGLLAILATINISIFRPGSTGEPNAQNEGLLAFIISLLLVVIYPEATLTFSIALILSIVVHGINHRAIPGREIRWSLWMMVPMLPGLLYYGMILRYNPAVREWFVQHVIPPPTLFMLFISLFFGVIVALPALLRAIRRFEPDGDRYMLLWLGAMLVLMYLPLSIGQHAAIGIMIPIAYFATRSLEDFWFDFVPRRWRYRILVAAIPLVMFSHVLVLFFPVLPLLNRSLGSPLGMVLEPEYRVAFQWMEPRLLPQNVVLAAPETSAWIPFHVGSRVVYGHPAETLDAPAKLEQVRSWYQDATPDDCQHILEGDGAFINSYTVDYVLIGPRERELGDTPCMDFIDRVASFGRVDIYRVVEN